MRIGVDIDDTITNSWECMIPYFAKTFNMDEEFLRTSKPYYFSIQDKVTIDEYFEKILPICDEVLPNAEVREHAKEVIDKLYEEGHHVIFITARDKGHTNPYKMTKDFLDKHDIKYDKVIVAASDKSKACEREKIDLFIDDSNKHCTLVSETGIDVLMFETYYNKDNKKFKHVKSWDEIYDYIKGR